jgi:hypothetical protein
VVIPYPNGSRAVRFWIDSQVSVAVASDGHHWHLQEAAAHSSTGEEYHCDPFRPADHRIAPQQAAMLALQYLITRFCVTVQHPELPLPSRSYAARALYSIIARMEAARHASSAVKAINLG